MIFLTRREFLKLGAVALVLPDFPDADKELEGTIEFGWAFPLAFPAYFEEPPPRKKTYIPIVARNEQLSSQSSQ